jgi:hypothetical protein
MSHQGADTSPQLPVVQSSEQQMIGKRKSSAKVTKQAKIKEDIRMLELQIVQLRICMTSALSKDQHRIELEEKIREKVELEKVLKKLVLNQMRQQRHREKKRLKLQGASFNESFEEHLKMQDAENFDPLSFPMNLSEGIYFPSLDGPLFM